jgi:hypothetical protein
MIKGRKEEKKEGYAQNLLSNPIELKEARKGRLCELQEYSHCGNEIVKINESCVKVAKVLWYINGTSEFRKRKRK